MNPNIMDMAKGYLSPDIVKKAGSYLGETPEATQRGLSGAVPAVLGGFVRQASSDPSGGSVSRILTEGHREGERLDDLSSGLGGGVNTENIAGRGQSMLGSLFGDRLPSAVDHVAGSSGLNRKSAGKLLALAAPFVGALVSREASANKLGPAGIASMLTSQKGAVASALGAGGLSSIFGGVGGEWAGEARASVPGRGREETRYQQVTPEGKPAGRRIGMPLILLGVLALLGLLLWFGRRPSAPVGVTAPDFRKEMPRAEAPKAPQIQAPQAPAVPTAELPQAAPPTVETPSVPPAIGGGPTAAATELNSFFANTSEPTPKRIPLEGMTFDFNSSQLTPSATKSIDDVAAALKAHPTAKVRIEGYADNTGSAQYNETLSGDRANAVKDALIRRGVDASQISIAGKGAANPIAPNETEEGRAANRRIDLVVMSR